MARTRDARNLIRYYAKAYGVDPRAALAVAAGEGGYVNRANDIGDKAGGGSYGPFQLYAQGALPKQYRGNPSAADQWAWSAEGIEYALRQMAEAGARGLTGRKAVETIIRKFERPADPDGSIAKAIARYGGVLAGSTPPGAIPTLGLPGASATPVLSPQLGTVFNSNNRLLGIPELDPALFAAPKLPPLPGLGEIGAGSARPVVPDSPKNWRRWVHVPASSGGPSPPHSRHILSEVARLAQMRGKKLAVWDNTTHSVTTVNGRRSAHADGQAADIPASGAELKRLGYNALVMAGMEPAAARKASRQGGLFNVGRYQVIFHTNQGGNHYDHLHLGLRG